jgi:prepilin-type N-terminal cleavage/methylation domain-containing protein
MQSDGVAGEAGYSLVELLVTMVILSVVMTGLITLFVQGTNAEMDMNRRFQAQTGARIAMDKLRREIHCASAVTPSGASSSVALTLASTCPTAGGVATTANWCALQAPSPAPTGQYALYRQTGASCTTGSGVQWADYLISSSVFNFTVQSTAKLGSLNVNLQINTKPALSMETFKLSDDLVLRNTTRTCIVGSPAPCP